MTIYVKNIFEGNKESLSEGIVQTGQATFNLFILVKLGQDLITQQLLNHALIFFTTVNNNCYQVGCWFCFFFFSGSNSP